MKQNLTLLEWPRRGYAAPPRADFNGLVLKKSAETEIDTHASSQRSQTAE
jgi:hypothetical protein